MKTQESRHLRYWRSGRNDTSKYVIGIDEEVRYASGRSAFIQSVNPIPGDFECFMQTFGAHDYRGEQIMLSAQVKTHEVRGNAGLFMNILDADRQSLVWSSASAAAITGTTDWTECRFVLNVPHNARYINVGSLLNGTGRVWIDCLKVERCCSTKPNPQPVSSVVSDINVPLLVSTKIEPIRSSSRLSEDWLPFQWETDYEFEIDQVSTNGTKACSIRSKSKQMPANGEKSSSGGTLNQRTDALPFRGKRVRFASLIKAEEVADWCGLSMYVVGEHEKTLAYTNMYRNPVTGTCDWAERGVVLDVPANAQSIVVWANLNGSGCARFSNFSLEEVGNDVETTDRNSVIENLDFSQYI